VPTVKLTPDFVKKAKPSSSVGRNPTFHWDSKLAGFALAVAPTGRKTFIVQYRAHHASRRMTIGRADVLAVGVARERARELLARVALGGDPLVDRRRKEEAGKNTFRAVAEEYLQREGKRLRTTKERRANLIRMVYPQFGSWQITDIRRTDIVRLLNKVEDERGAAAADHALAIVRRVLNWFATISDDYRSPVVPGMARTKPEDKERSRVLSDDELRAVWRAAGQLSVPWGAYVKFLLLTAARRTEAARASWNEMRGNDWVLPAGRYKTKTEMVFPLSVAARRALENLPRVHETRWVFTTRGKEPIAGFTAFKRKLDAACGVADWRLHDLRRTARSLMSRAGVNADIAERCLGHVIGGVRGVYDRHKYLDEMRHAFEALSSQIDRIVDPQDNIVPIVTRR
jgi:integrase